MPTALDFIHDLLGAGRVRVGATLEPPAQLREAVLTLDEEARAMLAYTPPALVPAAGEWALLLTYRACQALVYRETEPDAVRVALAEPCPTSRAPGVCYSVDLAFCVLPELLALARGIDRDDPLVAGLNDLARAWPLSSVGVRDLDGRELDVAPFIDHPGLRRLYADRIIERADVSRLADSRARAAVREALGAFPELAPKPIAEALKEEPACP